MRFEPECTLPELVKTIARVAFEVDDMDAALAGRQVIARLVADATLVAILLFISAGTPVIPSTPRIR